MSDSSKTSITKEEYLQIVGLLALAKRHVEFLRHIEEVLIHLTGEQIEVGEGGDCSDVIYSQETAKSLLKTLGVKVV